MATKSVFANAGRVEDLAFPAPDAVRAAVEAALEGPASSHHRELGNHVGRYCLSLARLPMARPGARVLEIGSSPLVWPVLRNVMGYESVLLTEYSATDCEVRTARPDFTGGEEVEVLYHDLEQGMAPVPSESVDLVVFWEVIEHLRQDPGFVLCEINRVLKTGGLMHVTTPNICSARSLAKQMALSQPMLYGKYHTDGVPIWRHQLEYAPVEFERFLGHMGFRTMRFETIDAYDAPDADVMAMLEAAGMETAMRGDTLCWFGRKRTSEVVRFSPVVYQLPGGGGIEKIDTLAAAHEPIAPRAVTLSL